MTLSVCLIAKNVPGIVQIKSLAQSIQDIVVEFRAPKRISLEKVVEGLRYSPLKIDYSPTKFSTASDYFLGENKSDQSDMVNHKLKLSDVIRTFLTFFPNEEAIAQQFAAIIKSVLILYIYSQDLTLNFRILSSLVSSILMKLLLTSRIKRRNSLIMLKKVPNTIMLPDLPYLSFRIAINHR